MQLQDKIQFGAHEWRVLAIQNNAALLLTEYIIEMRPYHHAYTDITWADCSLRAYLNNDFYRRFSEADRAKILPVTNTNPDNHWYGTKGGADTQDNIFLLSLEEVACHYFGDSSALLYNPRKNQRYWFERKDKNNPNRKTTPLGQVWNSWWWLRTPGRVGVKAVYVHGDGNIGIQGNNILKGNLADGECRGGVRPALWVRVGE